MNIYRLLNPSRAYKTINYSNTPMFDNIGKVVWDNVNEISKFNYTWNINDESLSICDCPFIIGSIPVFNLMAYNKLLMYLNKENTQIIPINVDGVPYFVVNATVLIDDILNSRKSKISYFSDGRIMDIEKYVFNKRKDIPNVFKISQYQTYTFVSDRIASVINSNMMTGIVLEKCKFSSFLSTFI